MAMNVSMSANAKPYDQYGQIRAARFKYTGPTAYATNGESIDGTVGTAVFGLGGIVTFAPAWALDASAATPYLLVYIPSTRKVKWFVGSTMAEVANGTNLSAWSAFITVEGF
jgi:hypothetical protein